MSFNSDRWAFSDLPFLSSSFFCFKLHHCLTFNLFGVCVFIVGYFNWNLYFDYHLNLE